MVDIVCGSVKGLYSFETFTSPRYTMLFLEHYIVPAKKKLQTRAGEMASFIIRNKQNLWKPTQLMLLDNECDRGDYA